jgi:formylglycine-generating enzyme required for sulfatase activity
MRNILYRGGVPLFLILLLTLSSCVSSDFAAIQTEPGFLYGYGTGDTEPAAQEAAFNDLVYTVFTETGSIKKDKKSKVILTSEMKASLAALKLQPFASEKKGSAFNAVYRVKTEVWTKAEAARLTQLSTDLGGRFAAVSGAGATKRSLVDRLNEASSIRVAIDHAGVPLTLRVGDESSPLLASTVEAWVQSQLTDLAFAAKPEGGLVQAGQAVKVTVTNKAQKALAGFPVEAVWTTEAASLPAVSLTTDATGSVSLEYPADPRFLNHKATLKVGSNLAPQQPEAAFLAGLDGVHRVDFSYRNAADLAQVQGNEVKVAGGAYTVGAVKQDRHAGGNEKPRSVTVATFYIDRYLVTNAQYLSYLETNNVPKDQWPDYLDSPDYSAPNQPVIGVSWEAANKYAAWLSGVLGKKKRLPTEDEYEVAARAGQSVVYPWGDQAPTDGVRADYSGNKKFTVTSPVGSFETGKNPLDLYDMVGNVWEWTSSSPDAAMSADPSFKIVKGGSWLDGPNELRISNRKAVDPAEPASDIGFRLVREASNE